MHRVHFRAALILLLILAPSACGLPVLPEPSPLPTVSMATETPPPDWEGSIRAVLCLDGTTSYRPDYWDAAFALVSQQMNNVAISPFRGMRLRLVEIDENSYDAESQLGVVLIPPSIQPSMPPTPSGVFDQAERDRIQAEYQAELASRHEKTRSDATHAAKEVERLHRPFPYAQTTDLGGCYQASHEVLQASPVSTGPRFLLLATDLDHTGGPTSRPPMLTSVHVKVFLFDCDVAAECADRREEWCGRFSAWGAASVNFYRQQDEFNLFDIPVHIRRNQEGELMCF